MILSLLRLRLRVKIKMRRGIVMGNETDGASRRDMLKIAGGTLTGLVVAGCSASEDGGAVTDRPDTAAIAKAERFAGVAFTETERAQMAGDLEARLATLEELRGVEKPNTLAPATTFDPRLPVIDYPTDQPDRVRVTPYRLQSKPSQNDIAFATITQLGAWLRSGVVTCRFITDVYLSRIEQHAEKLECFVTVLANRARAESRCARCRTRFGPQAGAAAWHSLCAERSF